MLGREDVALMSTKLGDGDYNGAIEIATGFINQRYLFLQFAYRIRATAYERMGNHLAALRDATSAINEDAGDIFPYETRAAAKLYGLNDFKGAIEDATKAIDIHRLYTSAYLIRAKAKLVAGDSASAKQDINIMLGFLAKRMPEETGSALAHLQREHNEGMKILEMIKNGKTVVGQAYELQRLFPAASEVTQKNSQSEQMRVDLSKREEELAQLSSIQFGMT